MASRAPLIAGVTFTAAAETPFMRPIVPPVLSSRPSYNPAEIAKHVAAMLGAEEGWCRPRDALYL